MAAANPNETIETFSEDDKVIYLPSSKRGKKKMKSYNDGHAYLDKGPIAGGKFHAWVCDQVKCVARIHVNSRDYIVKRINQHTHTRDPTLIRRAQVICYFYFLQALNGILLPKLFWSTVRKNCSSD
jgi:hypothetical protein